jgi:beta-carotene hydroxylase
MLRYAADRRTLLYLGFTALLVAVNWHLGRIHPVLYSVQLFMFFAAAVISHNHNHLSIWKSRGANLATSWVISLFYGHPSIGWVPTHNQIHHKLNNKAGDSSRSPKVFRGNHLLSILVYPTVTSIVQTRDIEAFLKDLWRRNRSAFWAAASEYAVFLGTMAALFLVDWRRALLFFLIPQQVSLFAIQAVNYLQHIETAADSKWNHSRNFVSPVLNALLFNNGYHTVHHMKPGVHWSLTPALHERHAANVSSALLVPSLFGYLGYTYCVRPFTGAGAPQMPASPG